MYSLLNALSRLFSPSQSDAQARHDRYLSQAVDMADLERRSRQLDGGHAELLRPGPHGIFSY